MVSITNVSAGQASTYYQKDNYYTKSEGQWQGKGAENLGLQGEVKKEDFESLIHGKAPDGNFEIQSGGEGQSHRAGIDLTFSAPKSVSIASEVLGDTRVREAHEKAVSEALRYTEQHFSQGRQTEKGITERVDTGNLVVAKFQHDTSRELDPQLHTHAVAMNMTQREDGQWRALSNEKIYDNKMLIGQVYRNELAANLKELGYEVQSDNKGLFEIRGIDEKLREHFSQRSEQIAEKVQELKDSGKYPNANEQQLREYATLGSRAAKGDVNMNTVRESWRDRLKEQGYTKEGIEQNIKAESDKAQQGELNRIEPKMNEYDYVRAAARIHAEQESTFSKEDILKTAGKLSVGEYRISDIEKAFNELNKDREIKTLDNGKGIYTTAEMQKIEKQNIEKMRQGQGKAEAILRKEQAEAGIKDFEQSRGFSLTQGQKDAVNHILTSKDKIIGIQGDAGTGKTTMLAAMKEQLEKQGFEVKGLGFTGKAAAEVEQQAGIKSQTIDSFLTSKDNSTGKQMWIVDEASMLGSRKMHELMQRAEQADAKLVLIGDTKQLQAIEAGKSFKDLQQNGMATVRMSEVQRQKEENYKDIVKDISDKRIEKAFDKLEKQDKIHEISNRDDRLNAIKDDYLQSNKNTIVVTARNADRNELNKMIRDELKQQNRIGQTDYAFNVRESKGLSPEAKHFAQSYSEGDRIIAGAAGILGRAGAEGTVKNIDYHNHKITLQTKDGKEHTLDLKTQGQHLQSYREKEQSFTAGDKVVFLKNDKGFNVKNGQIGEIKNIDKDGNATIQMNTGETKNINLKTQYNYLDHGYAVTDYKSQGQTADKVIYHADTRKEVNYNQAYVAMTRGKEDLKIYTDNKENFREQMKHEQIKTSTLDHKTASNDLKNELSEARKDMLSVDIQIAKAKESGQDAKELEQKRAGMQERVNTLKNAQYAIRSERREKKDTETQKQKQNVELAKKSGAYFRVQKSGNKELQKQQKEYIKYQSMLSNKDFQKLKEQDPKQAEKERKKATGLSSLILNTKTRHDSRTNTLIVKQEKDIASAVKNRIGDWLKEKAYNATAGVITLTKKDLKTRTNEVYIQRENGKVEKAIQIQKTHIHKSKLSSDKSYLKTETITYRKDGSISIHRYEKDLKTGFDKESSYTLKPDEIKANRIEKSEYNFAKQQSQKSKTERPETMKQHDAKQTETTVSHDRETMERTETEQAKQTETKQSVSRETTRTETAKTDKTETAKTEKSEGKESSKSEEKGSEKSRDDSREIEHSQ
ncbi:MAG: MobF family relaxase [Nitrospirota bacterium]